MKRIYILAVALVAAFAASVVVVSAASAVELLLALWLDGGSPVTAGLLVEIEGELELVSLNAGGFGIETTLLCSGIFDGWIGAESLGWISDLLTLGGVLVPTTPLTGTPLLCTNIKNCTEPEVWADVPFETEAELAISGTETSFVDSISSGGWYAQCLVLGITSSELCEWPTKWLGKLINEVAGIVKVVLTDLIIEKLGGHLGKCTVGGAETAEVNWEATMLESGVALAVSSE